MGRHGNCREGAPPGASAETTGTELTSELGAFPWFLPQSVPRDGCGGANHGAANGPGSAPLRGSESPLVFPNRRATCPTVAQCPGAPLQPPTARSPGAARAATSGSCAGSRAPARPAHPPWPASRAPGPWPPTCAVRDTGRRLAQLRDKPLSLAHGSLRLHPHQQVQVRRQPRHAPDDAGGRYPRGQRFPMPTGSSMRACAAPQGQQSRTGWRALDAKLEDGDVLVAVAIDRPGRRDESESAWVGHM